MAEVKRKNTVHPRNVQAISSLFVHKEDSEQTEEFAESAAESMKHRKQLYEYIQQHTDPTMLYRDGGQTDRAQQPSQPTVTPIKQAKRRNKDLPTPAMDIYQYFTQRGGMCGDTVMENKRGRLAGMAFLATHTANKNSPYQRNSGEIKTQMLIHSANNAKQLEQEDEESKEIAVDSKHNEVVTNARKLAQDGSQPQRLELAQLVQQVTNVASEEAADTHQDVQDVEATKRLAQQYITKKKKKETFLNLSNMEYRRDRPKIDRMAADDSVLETGKAIAHLVLEQTQDDGKTLAKILSINEAEQVEDTPPKDDDIGDQSDSGGDDIEDRVY